MIIYNSKVQALIALIDSGVDQNMIKADTAKDLRIPPQSLDAYLSAHAMWQ